MHPKYMYKQISFHKKQKKKTDEIYVDVLYTEKELSKNVVITFTIQIKEKYSH